MCYDDTNMLTDKFEYSTMKDKINKIVSRYMSLD